MNLLEKYIKLRRKLILIPLVILLISSSYLAFKYFTTGKIIEKDISLKGGTVITIYTNKSLNFSDEFEVRELKNAFGKVTGYELITDRELSDNEINELRKLYGNDISVGTQSASIASSFFIDMIKVLLIGFMLMAIVSFYYFKNVAQSLTIFAIIIFDFIEVIAAMSLLNIKLSLTSIGALLMMIDYSTDGNILISSFILKKKESDVKERIKRAFKIDFVCDIAAYTVFTIMFLFSPIEVIKEIALILLLGTFFDQINNWLLTAPLNVMKVEG